MSDASKPLTADEERECRRHCDSFIRRFFATLEAVRAELTEATQVNAAHVVARDRLTLELAATREELDRMRADRDSADMVLERARAELAAMTKRAEEAEASLADATDKVDAVNEKRAIDAPKPLSAEDESYCRSAHPQGINLWGWPEWRKAWIPRIWATLDCERVSHNVLLHQAQRDLAAMTTRAEEAEAKLEMAIAQRDAELGGHVAARDTLREYSRDLDTLRKALRHIAWEPLGAPDATDSEALEAAAEIARKVIAAVSAPTDQTSGAATRNSATEDAARSTLLPVGPTEGGPERAYTPDEYDVLNLVAWVRRLCRRVRKHEPDSEMVSKAYEFLDRRGMRSPSDVLREAPVASLAEVRKAAGECSTCEGRGWLPRTFRDQDPLNRGTCQVCSGSGMVDPLAEVRKVVSEMREYNRLDAQAGRWADRLDAAMGGKT